VILTDAAPHEIVYIDPPWPRTKCGTAVTPYKTMSWDDLRAFDLGAWLARDAIVFCWTTGPTHLKECAVLSHWCDRFGLYEAGIAYVWVKTRKDGVTPIGASGPRAKLVKPLTESVLALTTRKRGRVFPLLTEAQVQTVFAPKPRRGEHSRKPAKVRSNIVELLGDHRSKAELFAREEFEGWNAFGDELVAA
jgi:N6-adenosine-specific RNA methylase IME4